MPDVTNDTAMSDNNNDCIQAAEGLYTLNYNKWNKNRRDAWRMDVNIEESAEEDGVGRYGVSNQQHGEYEKSGDNSDQDSISDKEGSSDEGIEDDSEEDGNESE